MDTEFLTKAIDLGGIFLLAGYTLFIVSKKLDRMDNRMVKILTLLTILVKSNSKFNHIDNLLGSDEPHVTDSIIKAENGYSNK